MSGPLFGRGAVWSESWHRRFVPLALLLAVSLYLTDRVVAQTRDTISAPPGWDPYEHVPYSFTPNDPYYFTGTPAGYPGQWHLNVQSSGAAYDARLTGAWNRDITGQGVTIGIVDDGLQSLHPDLNPNFVAADSWNFGNNTADPSPFNSNAAANNPTGDNHGTSVAGVAAARGGNGIGVTGAAPFAGLAGLRVDFPTQTTQMFVDATLYHSSGANTNIKIKNHSYGISAPYIPTVAEGNAVVTSSNAGTIHLFAAGNERCVEQSTCTFQNDGDSNKKYLQSLQETIDVAALGSNGKFASYSNWGANIWVTAPSNTSGGLSITTTDRTGGAATTGGYNNSAGGDIDAFPDLNYNAIFGGTSSATPLVSGIMALGKQVQPNLDVRMAKHLLARTSRLIDPTDTDAHSNCIALPACIGGWVTNAGGFHFDENYGFGLIDADEFTRQAVLFSGVTPLTTQTIGPTIVNQTIPDNNVTGISRTFNLAAGLPLEEVEVHLDVSNHAYRGDVEAFLRSPAGTVSRLMYRNFGDGDGGANIPTAINWTFLTNEFWGENPAGTWTLTLRDVYTVGVGTWNDFSVLAKMGTLVTVPEPGSLMLTSFGLLGLAFRRSRRR
jgi:subtilisin-like proprotein convertase family protein